MFRISQLLLKTVAKRNPALNDSRGRLAVFPWGLDRKKQMVFVKGPGCSMEEPGVRRGRGLEVVFANPFSVGSPSVGECANWEFSCLIPAGPDSHANVPSVLSTGRPEMEAGDEA